MLKVQWAIKEHVFHMCVFIWMISLKGVAFADHSKHLKEKQLVHLREQL